MNSFTFSKSGDQIISLLSETSDTTAKWPFILQCPQIINALVKITSKTHIDSQLEYTAELNEISKNELNQITITLSSININGRFIADDGLVVKFDDIVNMEIITPGIEANFHLIDICIPDKTTPRGFELPITRNNEIDLWYLVAFHKNLALKSSFAEWLKSTDIEGYAKAKNLKFGKPISLTSIDDSKQKHFRTIWENEFCKHWSSFDFWIYNIQSDQAQKSRPATPFLPKHTSSARASRASSPAHSILGINSTQGSSSRPFARYTLEGKEMRRSPSTHTTSPGCWNLWTAKNASSR